MSLRTAAFQTSYRRGTHDIAAEFYLPAMALSNAYDRAVGFFSSSVLALAWPSLGAFLDNGGTIRLLTSNRLPPQDIEELRRVYEASGGEEEVLWTVVRRWLEDPTLVRPAQVFGKLVSLGIIELKVAVMVNSSTKLERLFHDKLGIFSDGECRVVFKGSMNESWAGLSADGNLESVDVFLSWAGEREAGRVQDEISFFEQAWSGEFPEFRVYDFPQAAREELIRAGDALQDWRQALEEVADQVTKEDEWTADGGPGRRRPRAHQARALDEWVNADRRGILKHATGSGKTFTAMCAMRDAFARDETPLVVVPSKLLLDQWYEEVRQAFADLEVQILRCGGGHDTWRREALLRPWSSPSSRARAILTTVSTAAGEAFRRQISDGPHLFMIGDEVHTLGSGARRQILGLESGPRLGLSATPERYGDSEGTRLILDYFGGILPSEYEIADAIRDGVLSPYIYHIHRVSLGPGEQEDWDEFSRKMARIVAQAEGIPPPGSPASRQLRQLAINRRRIVKQAYAKVAEAIRIVAEEYSEGDRWLVYCDDTAQLENVLQGLRQAGLPALAYHHSMRGDRVGTMRSFELLGGVLVAIKCLDEGVDIPSATHALILASSKNPREFIQRRGRILRRSIGKHLAHLHDVLVVPEGGGRGADSGAADSIVTAELARAIKFGEDALNPSAVAELQGLAIDWDLNLETLQTEGFEDDEPPG